MDVENTGLEFLKFFSERLELFLGVHGWSVVVEEKR